MRFGRSGQARRSITTISTDKGTETQIRKLKQPVIVCSPGTSAPGAIQSRRQPSPLAPTQRARGGSGKSAQRLDRPGTLVAKAAKAAVIAVSTAPTAARARSGTCMRSMKPPVPIQAARTTPTTSVTPSQSAARASGVGSGRTGSRPPASSSTSRS